jgi:hypothetical protein
MDGTGSSDLTLLSSLTAKLPVLLPHFAARQLELNYGLPVEEGHRQRF